MAGGDDQLTTNDLRRLCAFREAARQVRSASVIDQGLSVKIGILRTQDGVPMADDTSGMLPTEPFRSLCMSLRLTYMDKEEAHFFGICGVLKKAASPDQWDRIKQLHAACWRRDRRWRSINRLLLPLADAMGDLVCRADFERVKNCEGSTCTLWFYDVSRNHTRRWCSMAVCGNRAKAAAHRARKRVDRREAFEAD